MKNRLLVSTIALLGCAVSAQALNVVIVAPIPTTATDFNAIIPIAKFDPALGQLLMVTVRLNATLDASLIAENRSGSPAMITGSVTNNISLTSPVGPLLSGSASTTPVGAQLVGPYDGTPFQNELPNGPFGPDTFRWTIVNGNVDQSNNYVLPADLAVFTGLGTLNYNVVGDSTFSLSSNTGNLAALATATAGGTITVTYEYVPEPATVGLVGMGALALIRRRRR